VSLQKVLEEWLDYGVNPRDTSALSAEDQRELVADIYTEERDLLGEAFSEMLARSPILHSELVRHYRANDAVQIYATVDRLMREFLIGSPWLEFEFNWTKERLDEYEED
jgi:hypothetical protein